MTNATLENTIYDVAIIGAGPVGLFAAFQAGVQEMKAVLIDTLEKVGGQCSVLYPEKFIYDIPGHEKITAQELIDNLKKQCNKFNHKYLLGNKVTNLIKDKTDEIFTLTATRNNVETTIRAKTAIIATGNGSFEPNKPLITNISKFEPSYVLYFIDNMSKFHNKNIAIAGGGDSAVDWAIMLLESHFPPKKLYFIHRRYEMKCHPNSLAKLNELKGSVLEFKIPFIASKLHGETSLNKVTLMYSKLQPTPATSNNTTSINNSIGGNPEQKIEDVDIEIDYFLPFFGLKADLTDTQNFKVDLTLTKHKIDVEHSTMSTARKKSIAVIPNCDEEKKPSNTTTAQPVEEKIEVQPITGVYAIGDICGYAGKTKLLVTGFHEAVVACNAITEYMSAKFGKKKKSFEYSSSKFKS